MKLFIYTIVILFFTLNSNAQNNSQDSLRKKPPLIVRHNANSALPDTIHIVGILAEQPVPGYCGVFCLGGTIKVKLTKKIPGYNNEFVYLVTACLTISVKKNDLVNVIASKLKSQETECYYKSIMNGFDSKGFPFYKLSETETSKIH